MDKPVIGIDLGTTFSAAAYVDESGNPTVIPNADGGTTTPSVVLIDGSTRMVGEPAMNQWVTNEDHVVRWIKRSMGESDYRFQGLSPVEISAEILKTLKADAELHLGAQVVEAVITCPAYFAATEIENTKKAGEAAGFRVREIVKEPTAAAVHYGVESMREGETILVCDLGGGTYDATVLTYEKGIFMPRASLGDRRLGGHDWTMELVDLVSERVLNELGEDPRDDLVQKQMLYEACEKAKRDYSQVAQVAIPCRVKGNLQQVEVTREDFEAKTEWLIEQVVLWSVRAVQKAILEWGDIEKILLVGGSSRLRRMSLALEAASKKKPIRAREPDLTVALGAAIIARGQVRRRRPSGSLAEVARGGLVDVEPGRILVRNLGTRIVVFEAGRARITNSTLIPHGTALPISAGSDGFAVSMNHQEVFDVPVVEFEDDEDFDVVANFRFSCPPGARKGDRIAVDIAYDVSGIPTVTAADRRTGKALSCRRLPYRDPELDAEVQIRVKPRWVIFAVDTSTSMKGVKMQFAQQAVVQNAKGLLEQSQGQCRVGVVTFDSDVRVVCPPSTDLGELERAVQTIRARGTTDMSEGIRRAVHLVMEAPAGADRDVVMVTDGMPDKPDAAVEAAAWAEERGVTLSSVGIGSEQVDLDFLNRLTPLSLVIDGTGSGLEAAMSTLLTRAEEARGGLVEVERGDRRAHE